MPMRLSLFIRSMLTVCVVLSLVGCSALNKSQAENRAMACIGEADRQLTLGHEAEARTWIDRAVAWNPDSVSTYVGPTADEDDQTGGIGLIQCLSAHCDWPDMTLYLTKAVANPHIASHWEVWEALAQAQDRMGQAAASRASYVSELDVLSGSELPSGTALVPLDPITLVLERAEAEWGAGEQAKARSDYEHVIERYPQGAQEAQNDLAYSEAVANVDLPEAYSLAQSSVSTARRDPDADDSEIGEDTDTLAWVEYRLGKFKAAARDSEESVSEIPSEPVTHYHLAMIYEALDDTADARIEIDRAAALCPSDADTRTALQVIDPTFPGVVHA
jgi:Tfp pilus assembly protein PilF